MKNLQLYRKKRNLTQSELAEKVGISVSAIEKYEAGTRTPLMKNAKKLANFFNITIDELLGREANNGSIRRNPRKAQ